MYSTFRRRVFHGRAVPLLSVLLLLLLVSCKFTLLQPEVEVDVRIPPSEWSAAGAAVGHRVVYPDGSGALREIYLPAGTCAAVIGVQRGYNVPIAAYPLGRLKPSGACIANHAEFALAGTHTVVPLRFRYGPAAQVLLELWDLSDRCKTVQLEALTREMEFEGEGDPWSCDLTRLKNAIARGRLNRLQVCDTDRFDVCLDLPADDWIAGNSLWKGTVSSIAIPGPGLTSIEFSGLYPGRHCFYSAASGLELHLYVDKKGGCRWVCDSLSDFSD